MMLPIDGNGQDFSENNGDSAIIELIDLAVSRLPLISRHIRFKLSLQQTASPNSAFNAINTSVGVTSALSPDLISKPNPAVHTHIMCQSQSVPDNK